MLGDPAAVTLIAIVEDFLVEYIQDLINLAKAHPRASVALGLALIGLYLAARRKPRLMREADNDLERLRETRTGTYDEIRPLR